MRYSGKVDFKVEYKLPIPKYSTYPSFDYASGIHKIGGHYYVASDDEKKFTQQIKRGLSKVIPGGASYTLKQFDLHG